VNRLLECHPDAEIFLLLRATSRREASNRVSVLDRQRKQVTEVLGDVCQPKLGLGSAYEPLAGRVTEIFHAAAHTKFPARQEEVEAVNVRGTENVVSFAIACRSLSPATPRIDGVRFGNPQRNDSGNGDERGAGFFQHIRAFETPRRNHCATVRGEPPGDDLSIYRPSIVVGDSVSGATLHFRGIYQIMKASYAGLLEFIPGHRSFWWMWCRSISWQMR
jgi:thioester reductase-like protein